MKTQKITRSHDMVDSLGYVRHVTVTIECDPGIHVATLLKGYYDENGDYHDFIGKRVKLRPDLERVDLSQIGKVMA